MITNIERATAHILSGAKISDAEALELSKVQGTDIYALFLAASQVKERFVGAEVNLCSIINAKSGRCPENCAFCAQSVHHQTAAPVYPLVDEDQIVACAGNAEKEGSIFFFIVTWCT